MYSAQMLPKEGHTQALTFSDLAVSTGFGGMGIRRPRLLFNSWVSAFSKEHSFYLAQNMRKG